MFTTAASRVVEQFMVDGVAFYHPGSSTPFFTTNARVQPRRTVAKRDVGGTDVVQEQYVQFQMPVERASRADIRVDDTVVVTSSRYNPDLVGRSGMVTDVLNATHLIEFTVGAWFDLQRARRGVV